MTIVAPTNKPVPHSHVDLLTAPIVGVLTTLLPGGQPHSCLVWVDFDGECARVNTTLERQSGRNLLANRGLSLLVVDPENTGRYIQIRGDAELVRQGAIEHLDALTRVYTRHPCFYGYVYPRRSVSGRPG
jgi:PPOX class probable F420-dependent enzyme